MFQTHVFYNTSKNCYKYKYYVFKNCICKYQKYYIILQYYKYYIILLPPESFGVGFLVVCI